MSILKMKYFVFFLCVCVCVCALPNEYTFINFARTAIIRFGKYRNNRARNQCEREKLKLFPSETMEFFQLI